MNATNRKIAGATAVVALYTLAAGAQMQRVSGTGTLEGQRPVIVTDGGEPGGAGLGVGPGGGVAAGVDPQVQDELLTGLDKLGANAKERNEVNLDKNMMALVGGKRGARYAELSQKMDFIVVRNYEFAAKGQYDKADLDALRHKLDGNGWSHLVRNESDGETNDIVIKSGGDGFISDMVILNAEPKELNIVHMRGHFHMDDVNGAMGSAMGVGGSAFGVANTISHGTSSHSDSHTDIAPPAPPALPPPPAPKR